MATLFRSATVTNTSTTIKTSGADVLQINIINRHSAAIFVKFYNQTVATFQDTPVCTLQVAANSYYPATLNGFKEQDPIITTIAGLCVRVVTDNTDAGNTAAGTLPIIEVAYV